MDIWDKLVYNTFIFVNSNTIFPNFLEVLFMKLVTRLLCLVLIAATAFTLVGCHEKGETVMTVGNVEIPSGLYITFQLNSFQQFVSAVDAELTEQAGGLTPTNGPETYADYLERSYQGKTAQVFINENAMELSKRYAWIKTEFDNQGLTLSETDLATIDYYAKQEWENVKDLYEPSGAGFESYKEYYATFNYKANMLFFHYYDKKNEENPKSGAEAVAEADLAKKLSENYLLIDVIEVSLTKTDAASGASSQMTDEEIEKKKTELTALADRINKGEKFADIYKEFNKKDAPSQMQQNTGIEVKSIYPETAFLLGKDDQNTGSLFTEFDKKRKEDGFAYNTAYVTGGKDDGYLYISVFYDLEKDPYYVELNRSSLLQTIKGDAFEKKINDGAAKLQAVNAEVFDHYQPDQFVFDKVEAQ